MAGWLAHDSCHHLEVGALTPEAGRELIAATATEGALPEPCVQFILQHGGGVALHLQQMVTAFLESSLLFLSAFSPSKPCRRGLGDKERAKQRHHMYWDPGYND